VIIRVKPVQYLKRPWKTLFKVFSVLCVIGFAVFIPDIMGKDIMKDFLDSMPPWITIILRINGYLSPVELFIAVMSYLKG
jgi:mannose/fructose/N-acetylgalactosamine-specific phosphotransferase system component IIC